MADPPVNVFANTHLTIGWWYLGWCFGVTMCTRGILAAVKARLANPGN